MRFLIPVLMALVILAAGSEKVHAEDDLFDTGKSDTAIKPFVFPKSMVVVQSCYTAALPGDSSKAAQDLCSQHGRITIDKSIKKILVKLDPARIAPARRGKDLKDKVNRITLNSLKNNYDADFIFLFRQFISGSENENRVTQGLVYLTRQDKLLVIPSNSRKFSGKPGSDSDLSSPQGLEQLAKDARKVIMSHKFEKRRSNY